MTWFLNVSSRKISPINFYNFRNLLFLPRSMKKIFETASKFAIILNNITGKKYPILLDFASPINFILDLEF